MFLEYGYVGLVTKRRCVWVFVGGMGGGGFSFVLVLVLHIHIPETSQNTTEVYLFGKKRR